MVEGLGNSGGRSAGNRPRDGARRRASIAERELRVPPADEPRETVRRTTRFVTNRLVRIVLLTLGVGLAVKDNVWASMAGSVTLAVFVIFTDMHHEASRK